MKTKLVKLLKISLLINSVVLFSCKQKEVKQERIIISTGEGLKLNTIKHTGKALIISNKDSGIGIVCKTTPPVKNKYKTFPLINECGDTIGIGTSL